MKTIVKVMLFVVAAIMCFSVVMADSEIPQGKKSPPGKMSPANVDPETATAQQIFTVTRDPFKQPTEVLPSDCPPSYPLCKFDYSQLRVVGVYQAGEGLQKAFIEDPDGRGYAISAGQMIGMATVLQITPEGIHLRVHRTSRDVVLPMFQQEGGKGGS